VPRRSGARPVFTNYCELVLPRSSDVNRAAAAITAASTARRSACSASSSQGLHLKTLVELRGSKRPAASRRPSSKTSGDQGAAGGCRGMQCRKREIVVPGDGRRKRRGAAPVRSAGCAAARDLVHAERPAAPPRGGGCDERVFCPALPLNAPVGDYARPRIGLSRSILPFRGC
jgi:hypothetical protein